MLIRKVSYHLSREPYLGHLVVKLFQLFANQSHGSSKASAKVVIHLVPRVASDAVHDVDPVGVVLCDEHCTLSKIPCRVLSEAESVFTTAFLRPVKRIVVAFQITTHSRILETCKVWDVERYRIGRISSRPLLVVPMPVPRSPSHGSTFLWLHSQSEAALCSASAHEGCAFTPSGSPLSLQC